MARERPVAQDVNAVHRTPIAGWQPGNEFYFREVRYRIVRVIEPADAVGRPGTFVVTPITADDLAA